MFLLEVGLEALVRKAVYESLKVIEGSVRLPHTRVIHVHAISILIVYLPI